MSDIQMVKFEQRDFNRVLINPNAVTAIREILEDYGYCEIYTNMCCHTVRGELRDVANKLGFLDRGGMWDDLPKEE